MDREVLCKLCFEEISAKDTANHLKICVESSIDIFDPATNHYYGEYCVLAFILGLTSNLDSKIKIKEFFDTIFVIYEYFYLNGLKSTKANPLWGLDQLCRTVICNVDEPEEKFLRIIPGLTFDDFQNESIIEDINVIFSETQIALLHQWETLFCAE